MKVIKFEATGTYWQIKYSPKNHINTDQVESSIKKIASKFEGTYSRFINSSEISILNSQRYINNPSNELVTLINWGILFEKLTKSRFSIGVGKHLERMGYDSKYSFKESKKLYKSNENLSLQFSERKLKLNSSHNIDIGAFGKGYLIDILSHFLKISKITHFEINAGGDILVENPKKSSIIHLENPFNFNEYIGEAKISSGSISSSSGNRRRWNTSHHLIDNQSGKPINDINSIFVFSKSAIISDTLSTSLFISIRDKNLFERLIKMFDSEVLIIFNSGRYYKTTKFPGTIY